MITTLFHVGGIGLAAPQIFVPRRLFIACVGDDPKSAPPEVFINPEITSGPRPWKGHGRVALVLGNFKSWSGDLSAVTIRYKNRFAERCEAEFSGLSARVIQHEHDHLHGILTIDRAESTEDIIKASEMAVALQSRLPGVR